MPVNALLRQQSDTGPSSLELGPALVARASLLEAASRIANDRRVGPTALIGRGERVVEGDRSGAALASERTSTRQSGTVSARPWAGLKPGGLACGLAAFRCNGSLGRDSTVQQADRGAPEWRK